MLIIISFHYFTIHYYTTFNVVFGRIINWCHLLPLIFLILIGHAIFRQWLLHFYLLLRWVSLSRSLLGLLSKFFSPHFFTVSCHRVLQTSLMINVDFIQWSTLVGLPYHYFNLWPYLYSAHPTSRRLRYEHGVTRPLEIQVIGDPKKKFYRWPLT